MGSGPSYGEARVRGSPGDFSGGNTLSIRTRLVSVVAAGALTAGGLAFAPAPAHAATTAPTATYTCTGTSGLKSISLPLTVTLQSLTDGLTTGTPLQPVLNSLVGQVGSVLTQLLDVVNGLLHTALDPLLNIINQLLGTAFGSSTSLTAQVADVEFDLVNSLGTTVSSLGGSLSQTFTLGDLSTLGQSNPLNLVLGNLTGGLTAPSDGTYSVTAPSAFDLKFLSSAVGSAVTTLGCTISTVGGATATVVDHNRIVLAGGVVSKTPTKTGTTGPKTAPALNPCTAALPKVGTKKTTLKLALAKKKVKARAHAKLTISGTYKAGGKKKAKGAVLVCDGTKALGYTTLKGKLKVALPKLAVGKHRLLVRFLGGGKAKPASKRITLTVKR